MPHADLAGIAAALHTELDSAAARIAVSGVTLSSADVRPGDLFAALPGASRHGIEFAVEAARSGAVAVLTDAEGAAGINVPLGVPLVVVADPRAVLGPRSSELYGRPSAAMTLVGVTGTNGKTSTVFFLEAAFAAAGFTTALLGTIETRIAGTRLSQARTTPEAPELQALLATAVERGVGAGAMEVSSHALALGRIAGTTFSAGIFTNLSPEHLDFHGTMPAYFEAKSKLFQKGTVQTAVICVDDSWGESLMERVRIPFVTYSASGVGWADWSAEVRHAGPSGSEFVAHGPAGEQVDLRIGIPGTVNVANALGALAAAVACGVDVDRAAAGICALPGIPGRLESVVAGQPYTALVDYAHTPGAVRAVLETLRPLTPGRLVVVLGCGGDRDRTKRAPMARAAAAGSDLAVLTSDNPRSEDPLEILADMTAGLDLPYVLEPDRARAIARAVDGLAPGDTVVVAGKGHETGQERGGVVTPFDDRTVLRAAIAKQLAAC